MTEHRDADGVIHETTTEARGATGNRTNFHVLAIGVGAIVLLFALIFLLGAM